MVQFRSAAREGSFSNRDFQAPDTVSKIQNEANRQLKGMNRAQKFQERNRQIFLEAQRQAQRIEESAATRAFNVTDSALKSELDSNTKAWERELAVNKGKQESKVDVLGKLVDFSKVAFDTYSSIQKINKDNQQKAINQISFKNNYSYDQLIAASQIDGDISRSEWQRTNLYKDLQAQGYDQDYVNTYYEHLVKGSGFRNYTENSNVLRATAEANADKINEIANDPRLTVEERKSRLDTLEAQMRGQLEIDGKIPSAKILESAYNPTMRRALSRADVVLNTARTNAANIQNSRDRNAIAINAANQGGSFNPSAAFGLFADDPRPNAPAETVEALITAQKLTPEQLQVMKTAKFIGPDGNPTSLLEGGYTDALKLIRNAEQQVMREVRDQAALEDQALEARTLDIGLAKAKELTQDGILSTEDYNAVLSEMERIGGPGRSTKYDQYFKNQTLDVQARREMSAVIQERIAERNLTEQDLIDMGAPQELTNQYLSVVRQMDKIKGSAEFKEIDKYLIGRIEGALRDSEKLKFLDGDKIKSDQVKWFLNQQVTKYRKEYIDALLTDTPGAKDIIGNKAATDTLEYANRPGNIDNYRITAYDEAMKKSRVDQLAITKELQAWSGLTSTEKANADNWLQTFGEESLVAASKDYEETGSSDLFKALGLQLGKTQVEIQNEIANRSEFIEPVTLNETYQSIRDSLSKDQVFTFTSDKVTNESKLRGLQKQLGVYENRAQTMRVRPVFETNPQASSSDSKLKSMVRGLESGNDYSSMFSRDRSDFSRGREDITQMTIDQVHDLQTDYLNHQASKGYGPDSRSAAMGAYQMMEVKRVAQSLGIDTSTTKFDKATQDRMADNYFNIAGYADFVKGKITAEEFNNRLATQFASIKTTSGRGVYDNDPMNNAYGDILPYVKTLEQ